MEKVTVATYTATERSTGGVGLDPLSRERGLAEGVARDGVGTSSTAPAAPSSSSSSISTSTSSSTSSEWEKNLERSFLGECQNESKTGETGEYDCCDCCYDYRSD